MSMERLFRIRCDETDCGQVQGCVSDNPEDARRRARMVGWDLGPRPARVAGVTNHTDFCPKHKKRDVPDFWAEQAKDAQQ